MIKIEHIDQIKWAVAGRTDFVVAERESYTAIDYAYALPDSFDDPIRRECRGLKFGRDGALIARPFGKFFNIGERPETLPHMIDSPKPFKQTEPPLTPLRGDTCRGPSAAVPTW